MSEHPLATGPSSRRPGVLPIVGLGLLGGLLIAGLEWLRYRYLLVQPSWELFGGFTAAVFAAVGLWLGRSLRRRKVIVREVPVPAPEAFARDEARAAEIGLTARELEILDLIAEGLSNREIAGRVFVSENTVKTHVARVLAKLGAKRRTQAVQVAREQRLVP